MNDAQTEAAPASRPAGSAGQERGARSENIEVAPLEGLSWKTSADVEASINTLYQYAETMADKSIRWYWNAKRPKARWSRSLRFAAIALATLGGLAPILAALDWLNQFSHLIGQLGYVSLGLAAACVGLDKFFGFSSGWMRYVTAAQALQEALSAFRMNWAKLSAQSQGQTPTPEGIQKAIQQVQDFVLVVDQIVGQETKAWVAEFQTSLADIDRTAAKSEKPYGQSS